MRTLCAIVSVLGVCLLTKTAAAITTATCFTPLFGFGPIDPVDGFPQYYQDSNGLALQQCLDAVCGGVGFVLPDPNLPLSSQDSPRIPASAGAALAFTQSITAGRVGPFLTALAPAPPPGLVGNPGANQTVAGSPCGTNIFRIEGPGFPPGGQQTDQFSTIIGK